VYRKISLGVNVDHVATLRNARGGSFPDPVSAARLVEEAGGDIVTVHLREDRRHIRDQDVIRIKNEITIPLNLEMAATEEMVSFALEHSPHSCCIVPERRQEITTEAGLDVISLSDALRPKVENLTQAGVVVSLFVSPDIEQVKASADLGVSILEFNTGTYCSHHADKRYAERDAELSRLREAMKVGASLGLEVYAGHGLNYETVEIISSIPELCGFNIGHFLVGEAIFVGLPAAIKEMRRRIEAVRYGG